MNTLTSAITKELDEIEEILVKGRVKEVIRRCDTILEQKEIIPEERIRSKLFQAIAENNLFIYRYVRDLESVERCNKLAKEAYEESKKIGNLDLLFDSTLYYGWSFQDFYESERAFELFQEVEILYEKIKGEDPKLLEQKKSMYIWLKATLPSIHSLFGLQVPEDYLQKGIQTIEQRLKLEEKREKISSINKFIFLHNCINTIGIFYGRIGKLDKSFVYWKKLQAFHERIGNRQGVVYALAGIASSYYSKGEYNDYLDLISSRLRILEELDDEIGIMMNNTNLGAYYFSQGDYDRSLEYHKKAYDYFQEINNEIAVTWISWDIGSIYLIKGDLDSASKFSEEAYSILNLRRPEHWYEILDSLAEIYLLKGELDEALRISQEGIEIHQITGFKPQIASFLSTISNILWQKGEKQEAVEKAEESLSMYEDFGNDIWIGYALSNLIFFVSELDKIKIASSHLQKLERIAKDTKDRKLIQRLNFSNALILKKSDNPRERMRADIILENLLLEDLEYTIQIKTILALCDLLIIELQSTGENELLNRLQKYVLDLYSLASTNNSFILTAETLMLQAKLALVDLDTAKATKLMEQANKIAEDKGLERLKTSIASEKEQFQGETDKIKELDLETPITERMEVISFDKRMNGIKKSSLTETKKDDSKASKRLFSISI